MSVTPGASPDRRQFDPAVELRGLRLLPGTRAVNVGGKLTVLTHVFSDVKERGIV